MGISNILIFIYVILILVFVVKAIGASNIKFKNSNNTSTQRQYNRNFESKYIKQNKASSTTQKMRTSDSYIDKERKKENKSPLKNIFGSRDVDCDLDERIFGPKNQHKDLF